MLKKIALFIGRFQPFHNGHLAVVKRLSKKYDLVKIGIGSSQICGTSQNPFTGAQRRWMIRDTMKAEGISNYAVYFLPDLEDDERWVRLARKTVGMIDVVYSGNPWVLRLFKTKTRVVRVRKMQPYSGTMIRDMIVRGEDVALLVPASTDTWMRKHCY